MTSRSKDLEGKVAIVTGAGIPGACGAVTAEALCEAGASVVLADLGRTPLVEVAGSLKAKGYKVANCELDLVEEESIKALIDYAVRTFGRLDIIVNNAAATHLVPRDRDILSMTGELWDLTMAINTRGPMYMCKHGIPQMLKQGGGAIVNISSGKALQGDVEAPAYAASKAALNILTKMVATLHGAQNIRCNTVLNGVIETPLMAAIVPKPMRDAIIADTMLGRLGNPLDTANAVVFLASDRAAYITGQALQIDGGILDHGPVFAWRKATADGTALTPLAAGQNATGGST